MRYTFFGFENFKGIRKAKLSLSPSESSARVHTLVGLNESGKTTILEAIDLFQPSEDVSPKVLGGWDPPDPDSLIPIAERTNFNGEIVIRCGVELSDEDVDAARRHLKIVSDGYRLEELNRRLMIRDRYIYANSRFQRRRTIWTDLNGSGKSRTGRKARPLTYDNDEPRWQQLATLIRSRLPTVWYFPNFLFDFPDKIFIEEAEGESPANRFYRALFADILDALGRDLDLEQHVVARARSDERADHENLQQVLLDTERHVTQTIVGAWNRIFVDKSLTQKRVRIDYGLEALDSSDITERDRLWVRFRIEDADGLFAISERSLGFRWFFVYLMLTTYRGRRKGLTGDMLFLFDEPASNLHPSAQQALLGTLEGLSRDSVIIYTTHSHHLINPEWLGTTSVVANAGLEAGTVDVDFTAQRTDVRITPYRRFAAEHPDQSHFFQPVLDVLRYAPSELELVPWVAMLEGKNDFYLLAYFERVYRGLPEDERLPFLPGGGAGSLDDAIQLYIAWSRPFVVLLDSDKEGGAQRKRYREKFGAILDRHLVSLDEASGLESAKGAESLLAPEDRLSFQRLLDPASTVYRKKALALGVQEALMTKQRVALSDYASKALSNVIAALRQRLDEQRP